nr:autophagy-related protein 18F-like [Ipomoea batatas]
MKNDCQKLPQEGGKGGGLRSCRSSKNGFIPTSFRALSRIMSSGASTVASTVKSAASAASAIVDRDNESTHCQVLWAGFDKIECEGRITRQVLLLGCWYGFQVWDVEEPDNVHNLVSKHDGPVSFMQILPKPISLKQHGDKFANSRPLLIICADGSFPGGSNASQGVTTPRNGTIHHSHDVTNSGFVPTVVWFYSLRAHSYVHHVKFRSVVHSVRCSSRVVAVLQASQIHCFNAATLERDYNIVTNPIVTGYSGSGNMGFGPLAVGPRWMAYTGNPVAVSNCGRVNPQHLTPSASFPTWGANGSLVAHYAKESSKQLAAGIVTLGDMGYKKLSRYYSELRPDGNGSQSGGAHLKIQGFTNGHLPEAESVGMVLVRDIVSKDLVTQFRAHKSPISSLCFDPSGILLVTASVHGHNINVFRIIPSLLKNSGANQASYVHLYRLQRGITDAVIQDISFSCDSRWIMISSSRGTNHLFAISPSGGSVSFQSSDAYLSARNNGSCVMAKTSAHWPPSGVQELNDQVICESGPPVTLSVVGRIRSGNNGWKNTVSGAAAAATGRTSSLSMAIASAFLYCKSNNHNFDPSLLVSNYCLLVFSASGCLTQYALRASPGMDSIAASPSLGTTCEPGVEPETKLIVEAIQKWNICQKLNHKEREDNVDIYGDFGNSDSSKIFPEGMRRENGKYHETIDKVKGKVSSEERQHMYISEAELHMHQPVTPLWARPEIYFQSILFNDISMDADGACGGEIEIERIPTRTVEARSKDLVPVYNYLQAPKIQQQRMSGNNDQLLNIQRSEVSGKDNPINSNLGYPHCTTNGCIEPYNGIEENGSNGCWMAPETTTKDIVYNSDSPKANTQLGFVNNSQISTKETQAKFVNNDIDGLKRKNHFEGEVEEFD